MGDYLKDEYRKRDEKIENAELYALIEILEYIRPRPLGLGPVDIQTMINNIDDKIRLLEQKIERSKNE